MHSHMNYSNNSPNRSNNISMHSHMSYYSPNSINRSNNTPLQHSHMDYSTNYSIISANMSNNLSMHSQMEINITSIDEPYNIYPILSKK